MAFQLVQRVHLGIPLDFQVYRDAALSMLHHGDIYHTHFTFARLNFTYPPFALLLLSLLTLAPPLASLATWWFFNVLALVALVTICLRELTSLRRFNLYVMAIVLVGTSCLLLQPLRSDMNFGQINFFLMLAVAYDIIRVRSARRGVLTGLAAAIKLTPLIYALYFLVSPARSAAWRVVGVFAGAASIAWLILPADSATFWLRQAFSPEHKGNPANPVNQSWFGFTGHVFANAPELRVVVWITLCALTLWFGVSLTRRYVTQERPVDALLALALTEVLVSPISWAHHWSWVVLIPMLVFVRWREHPVVASTMMFALGVCVAAPYRWYHFSWCSHGVVYDLVGYSLVLVGAALLGVMYGTERMPRPRAGELRSRATELADAVVTGEIG